MRLRSLLFVPADRPERFDKAAASGADALILDLEDSVALSNKAQGRSAIAEWLQRDRSVPAFVRINPLGSGLAEADLAAVLAAKPDGFVLPKAEGAASVKALSQLVGNGYPILPIATETPAAIFQLGSYAEVRDLLAGLTWGAEDLPAAIGATTSRQEDGCYTAPYEMVRGLTLFAAHAAGAAAIETVYPAIRDEAGLAAYAARGARDGFTGMMALHPAQVPIINAAFTPTTEQLGLARDIVDAFAREPEAGVLVVRGRMVDAPHLLQARKLLDRHDDVGQA
jgi:citrate lyase subunit beta/citryl-CoA lyase